MRNLFHVNFNNKLVKSVLLCLLGFCLIAGAHGAEKSPREEQAARKFRRFTTNLQFNRAGHVHLIRLSKSAIVNDDTLKELSNFPHLAYLAIVSPNVTDAGLANLKTLSKLETLFLSETQISDRGFAHLRSLKKLERLILSGGKLTGSGLKHLAGLKTLKVLSLENTGVTDAGLTHLKSLENLETLILDGTKVTDHGLRQLGSMKSLKLFSVAGCSVTGEFLTGWSPSSKLMQLNLTETHIRKKHLRSLLKLKSLKHVELYRTKITRADIETFKLARSKTAYYLSPERSTRQASTAKTLIPHKRADLPAKLSPVQTPLEARIQTDKKLVPDFQRHVIPLLGRLGCNGRSCHGSFQGQGGFRLSMFGYDFAMDHKNLRERIDLKSPAKSLVLNKPTSEDEHGGGLRLHAGSWEQNVLHRWIVGGAKGVPANSARFVRLEVTPREIVFQKIGETVQLRAVSVWSDGSREDVTCITRFQSKDDSIAEVSPTGMVRSKGKGDTHIISFYDNGIIATPVMHPVSSLTGERYPKVATRTKIDEYVVAKLKKLGIRPSPVCTDEEFLRRVSLDIAGTLPTPAEIRAFLKDSSPDKRAKKIDELLQHPAYVTWWTTKLCDLTGSNAGYLGGTEMAQPVAAQWRAWMERRVRENIGWDKIVAGIVLARSRPAGQPYGKFIARQSEYTRRKNAADFAAIGNPMPHFWFRSNLSKPTDKALAFGYTFLGVRLDCAQCHKHPFDQWSKQDFEQFTQFFTRIKAGVAPDAVAHHQRMRETLGVPDKLNTAALRRQSYLRIAAEGRPIPWKEIYIASPGQKPQIGKLLGGQPIDLNQFADPRRPLMNWLLTEPNRYLARSFVNRVWASYFHTGIINPPDDLNLANPPSNRELLDELVNGFIKSGYDMRWLHRTITNSETYQRSWRPNETNRNDERNFSRAVLRRLPAEVTIDAIIQATANSKGLTAFAKPLKNRKIGQHPRSFQARSIDFSLLIFGKPLRTTNCDCERQNEPTLLQSLYVRNDQEMIDRLDRSDGWLAELKRKKLDRTKTDSLITEAYLRVLSRHPTKQELADCRKHIADSTDVLEGVRDLLWALLNTQEFITNH
ncbi:MAG: hypothetical protein Tsb009_28590 [Planctomycetaceae bacterium]